MAEERIPIDISNEPALVRLAEDARAQGASFVLQVNGEDVAVLSPARQGEARGKVLTGEDALFQLVGVGSSGIPGGMSERKQEALQRAKRSP